MKHIIELLLGVKNKTCMNKKKDFIKFEEAHLVENYYPEAKATLELFNSIPVEDILVLCRLLEHKAILLLDSTYGTDIEIQFKEMMLTLKKYFHFRTEISW
jgi:hypothetical protein